VLDSGSVLAFDVAVESRLTNRSIPPALSRVRRFQVPKTIVRKDLLGIQTCKIGTSGLAFPLGP
jgi:hypothetical protein